MSGAILPPLRRALGLCALTLVARAAGRGAATLEPASSRKDRMSSSAPRLRAIFSDLDGTLVHFPAWFEEHGTRIISPDVSSERATVESPAGERRECRVLPSSTMGPGLVSERSAELVAQLRSEGVLFVVVTAARKSTLLERLPLLPDCDAAVSETGSRVCARCSRIRLILPAPPPTHCPTHPHPSRGADLGGGQPVQQAADLAATLDVPWALGLEPICGPIEREMEHAARPEPLWQFFRRLQRVEGLNVDGRSYYGCFRADTKGDAATDERLRTVLERELPCAARRPRNSSRHIHHTGAAMSSTRLIGALVASQARHRLGDEPGQVRLLPRRLRQGKCRRLPAGIT